MELRGCISIARRVSCNVWCTNLSSIMAHQWKRKYYRDKRVSQKGPGEFVVNVWECLLGRLKEFFCDQYVVSLLSVWGQLIFFPIFIFYA